ncbi:ATP-grasp domain-containing protein [Algicola sagamiensis]|uniref:ATP-grasp domain-containing protein n=1 Tax=Algicola sagamiensis TaxID=163869 RepID=UPI00036041BE|nr:ATP-grasp domain-containing protein [Algicola sagamiensis]
MKTVVFIETNFSGLDAIAYCKAKGYRAVLVTDSFDRFRNWFPEASLSKLDKVDQVVSVQCSSDVDEVVEALQKQVEQIDAVLTFAEIRTLTAAVICQRLGLKGAEPESIEIAQDKYLFRKVLLEKDADRVQCQQLSRKDIGCGVATPDLFPCFVKPVFGHSSIGARLCHSIEDMNAVFDQLEATEEEWISEMVVAEDYLCGELYSVEMLTTNAGVHQVVGISDRSTVNGSIEIGASFPLKDEINEVIISKACAALDAIGYDFGASHVEIILTDNGPHLVEINTRVGGSGHSVMMDLSTSRSIVGDCVELALGQLEAKTPLYEHQQGAAWHCYISQEPGLIQSLPSMEAIKACTGVKDVWFHHDAGDHIDGIESNFNWIVQVMCVGEEQQQAKQNAMSAIQFIESHAAFIPGAE